jgi:ankyrin repeat protein
LNYSQSHLIAKFNEYVNLPGKDKTLPFTSSAGLCSGLNAYWLYSIRNDEEAEFKRNLEYILNWDKDRFLADGTKDDDVFELVLNTIAFLQFQFHLIHGLRQESYKESFEMLRHKSGADVSLPEFTMTMVFDHQGLRNLLSIIAHPKKMLRFVNSLHNVSLINLNDSYHFYNPDSESGPTATKSIDEIVTAIFEGLGFYCGSKRFIALNINVYDLANSSIGEYPNVKEYRKTLLANPDYKQAVIKHDNILHTTASSRDFDMLNALFGLGYKYIPWDKHGTPELNESIALNDRKMFRYLIKHGIPLDYRAPNGITPIAAAISSKNNNMLYMLLQQGADINATPHRSMSLIQIACVKNNPEAIILALANGYNLSKKEQDMIDKKFGANTLKVILNKSTAMQNEIVKIISQTTLAITSKPINSHKSKDIQEINKIANILEQIIKNKLNPQLTKLAQESLHKITSYLSDNKQPRQTLLLSTTLQKNLYNLTAKQLESFISIKPTSIN